MFPGLPDPNPDPLVRETDPDLAPKPAPDPDLAPKPAPDPSIIKQKL